MCEGEGVEGEGVRGGVCGGVVGADVGYVKGGKVYITERK